MDRDQNDNGAESFAQRSGGFIAVWLVALILFLVLPCCFSERKRRLWLTRLKERRWHVHIEPREEPSWYIAARERYEAARRRAEELENPNATSSALSRREEEEIRQDFLLEQLSKYSSTITKKDFIEKADSQPVSLQPISTPEPVESLDIEMGKKNDANEEDVSSTSLTKKDFIAKADSQPISLQPISTQEPDESLDIEMGKKNDANEEDVSDTLPDDIVEDSNVVISIPPGGVCVAAASENAESDLPQREVPNGCAVCLSSFAAGEVITWAANSNCSHAFHDDCILNWLLAVGRKRRNRDSNPIDDPVKEALNFPMLCPCCRQQFVSMPEELKVCALEETTSEESA